MASAPSVKILDSRRTTGAGDRHNPVRGGLRSFQAVGKTTAGSGACVVRIQVSNNGVDWISAGTITLTLSATNSTDGFVTYMSWQYVRANVDSISGTNAAVSVWMGA